MKTIIFAIVLFVMSLPAMADTVFYIEKPDGGRIQFMDDTCPTHEKASVVADFTKAGVNLYGCYFMDMENEDLVVFWAMEPVVQARYSMRDVKLTSYYYKNYGN